MSWPETPCANCPVGEGCKAMRLRVRRYCELVDPDHPAFNPAYVDRLRGGPGAAPAADRGDEASETAAPGLLAQAATFTTAVVRHVLAGSPAVTPEQKEARLAICRGCEFFDADREKCRRCGCALGYKASWALEQCPLDPPKWGRINVAAEAEASPAK